MYIHMYNVFKVANGIGCKLHSNTIMYILKGIIIIYTFWSTHIHVCIANNIHTCIIG